MSCFTFHVCLICLSNDHFGTRLCYFCFICLCHCSFGSLFKNYSEHNCFVTYQVVVCVALFLFYFFLESWQCIIKRGEQNCPVQWVIFPFISQVRISSSSLLPSLNWWVCTRKVCAMWWGRCELVPLVLQELTRNVLHRCWRNSTFPIQNENKGLNTMCRNGHECSSTKVQVTC